MAEVERLVNDELDRVTQEHWTYCVKKCRKFARGKLCKRNRTANVRRRQ
jgi:hypothetical protein